MKIIKSTNRADGRRIVTVEVSRLEVQSGYELMLVQHGGMYRLGGQCDDIVPDHVITEMRPVQWCHVSQKWVD